MGIIYIYSIHRPVNKIYFIVMNADNFVIYADTLVCAFPSSPYTDHIVLYRISIQTRMRRPLLTAAVHQGLGEVPTSILKTGPRPGFKNRSLVPGCTACHFCVTLNKIQNFSQPYFVKKKKTPQKNRNDPNRGVFSFKKNNLTYLEILLHYML